MTLSLIQSYRKIRNVSVCVVSCVYRQTTEAAAGVDVLLNQNAFSLHFLLLEYICICRYEKENSSMKSWLDRCESVCCPDTDLLSADKIKLRNELQNVQVKKLLLECTF